MALSEVQSFMGSPTDGNQDPQSPAYTAVLVDPGFPHCGHGKRWTIAGPTSDPDDDYACWNESMINAEVERLNRVLQAGRRSISAKQVT